MRLIFLLALIVSPPAAAAADCPGILKVSATHSNRWQWTRDSVNGIKNTNAELHFWEYLYQFPLAILAAPGDVVAMPFRRNGIYVRASLQGSIIGADGKPLADFPWKAWPWRYRDHRGQKALRGWVKSYERPCTTARPCADDETQMDEFEFGTNSEGAFVLTFEGFLVRDGYIEVSFPAPLDRTIRIVREKNGELAAREPISGEDICQLTMRESAAPPPSK